MGETGVEPLRRVRRCHLVDEHVLQLVFEGLGILGGGEIAVRFAPESPRIGEAADDLSSRTLGAEHGHAVIGGERFAISVNLWHACFAEVLTNHDVGSDLRPTHRNFGVLHLEDDRSIGIGDARGARRPLKRSEGIGSRFSEEAFDGESTADGRFFTSFDTLLIFNWEDCAFAFRHHSSPCR
jgi:hypothetical protein